MDNNQNQYVKPALFSYRGRRNRASFILVNLVIYILGALLSYAALYVSGLGMSDSMNPETTTALMGASLFFEVFFIVVLWLVGLLTWIQRLHDTGNSGLWVIAKAIPLANIVLLLYLVFCPGTPGRNIYGPNPLGVEEE